MVRLKQAVFALAVGMALTGAGGIAALAQDHHDHHDFQDHHDRRGGPGGGGFAPHATVRSGTHWTHRDVAHFSPAERSAWVGGRWHHEWHNGRFGWWWGVGGAWYFYPAPIYPYPDYVADIYYDPGMVAPPPEAPVAPVAGYQPGYWYYCPPSGAYYPYVQSCPVPWTPVSPTPPSQ